MAHANSEASQWRVRTTGVVAITRHLHIKSTGVVKIGHKACVGLGGSCGTSWRRALADTVGTADVGSGHSSEPRVPCQPCQCFLATSLQWGPFLAAPRRDQSRPRSSPTHARPLCRQTRHCKRRSQSPQPGAARAAAPNFAKKPAQRAQPALRPVERLDGGYVLLCYCALGCLLVFVFIYLPKHVIEHAWGKILSSGNY